MARAKRKLTYTFPGLIEERDEATRQAERFRVYLLKPGRHEPGLYIEPENKTLVCIASTPANLEQCLLTLREEEQITHDSVVGIKDDVERQWLINPFAKGDKE